jgi:hypothetical protein
LHGGEGVKLLLVLILLVAVGGVSAENYLNSLNTIEYVQGEMIEFGTKILGDDAFAVADASCQAYVLKDSDNSVMLDTVNLTYSETEEHYDYYWVPELTWWENIEQVWNPAIGNYHAYISCSGGSLNRQLFDIVAVQVVE